MSNLRTKLTRQMIEQALLALLKEKKIQKITVLELCERAQLNRATFYRHYGSPYDVLEVIIDDFFEGLKSTVNTETGADFVTEEMLLYLMENRKKCLILLDCLPYETFTERLIRLSVPTECFLARFSDSYTSEEKEYLLNGYRHSVFGMMSFWLHQKDPMHVDKMLCITKKLSENEMFK